MLQRTNRTRSWSLVVIAISVVLLVAAISLVPGGAPWTSKPAQASSNYDWPTLGHDMSRSGSTDVGPVGPYTEQWYRDFWSELGDTVSDGYQPVVVNDAVHNVNLVYVGTIGGALYALDLSTGATFWRYPTVGQNIGGILSPPTVANGIVYVTSLDGNVYALDGTNVSNGTPTVRWTFSTGRQGGFWATPALDSTNLYVGGRDGSFYAINLATGIKAWEYNVGAPILTTPAYNNGVVYFGAEDMHGYALNVPGGTLLWQSAQLAGRSMRGSFPVLAGSRVLFRTAPNDETDYVLPEGEQLLAFAAACTNYPINPDYMRDNAPCFNWNATATSPMSYTVESQAVRSYLSGSGYQTILGRPQYETFHSLLRSDGTKPVIMPVLFTAGYGNPPTAPVVDPSGRVWVLDKSYYTNYDSPATYIMTGFGQIDPTTGTIAIRNGSGDLNPFDTNVWMIADEQTAFSVAGNQIYTSQWSGLGTVDITSGTMQPIAGYRDGFESFISEFHQRSLTYGTIPPRFMENVGPPVFGNNVVAHYNSIVANFQGQLSGVTATPQPTATPEPIRTFTPTTAGPVNIPAASALQQYILQVPTSLYLDSTDSADLVSTLNAQVSTLLSTGRLAPWIYIPGHNIVHAYFQLPSDTQYALGLAYPYLSPSLQSSVVNFVKNEELTFNPLSGMYPLNQGLTYLNGQVVATSGQQRLPFAPGPNFYCAAISPCEGLNGDFGGYWSVPAPFDRLYGIWTYAYRTGDWSWIQSNWSSIKGMKTTVDITSDAGLLGLCTTTTPSCWGMDDSANRRLSALIAYARIAYQLNDQTELTWATNAATLAMQARLRYVNNFRPSDGNGRDENSGTWITTQKGGDGGLFVQRIGWNITNIPQYRELTPDVARLLLDYAASDFARYDNFLTTGYPATYLQMGGNNFNGEISTTFPTNVHGVFLAKALVSRLAGPQMRTYLDIPWVQEDLFYWERLTRTIDAYGVPATIDLTNPSQPAVPLYNPTSIPVKK